MKNKNEVIFSGMQPTGELHIGNYFGALKNFVELQKSHTCYFFIASYHSLTIPYDQQEKKRHIRNLAKAYLAAGIDPKKAVIFNQADVVEHLELYWILSTLTPLAEAERMTQFKDKSAKHDAHINIGLLTYPILQAADILLYHGTTVPVGIDQVQHVELTRKIARWFNNRYETNYFKEPKELLTPTPKIQSLQNPEKKMSKSDGANAYLGLFDDEDTLRKKINKAVTGTGTEETIPAGAQNLLAILNECNAKELVKKYTKEIANKTVRYGDMKKDVFETLNAHLAPIRARYAKITDAQVDKILTQGAKKARTVAQKNMKEIKKIVGLS